MNNKYNNDLFTVVWKIENWRMKSTYLIKSSSFTVKKFLNTSWDLYWDGESSDDKLSDVSACLERKTDLEGPDKVKLHFKIIWSDDLNEIFILNNQPNLENMQTETFRKGSYFYEKLALERGEKKSISSEFIYIICYMLIDWEETEKGETVDSLIPIYLRHHLEKCNSSMFFSESMQKDLQRLQKKFFDFSEYCFIKTVIPLEKKKLTWSMKHVLSNCEKRQGSVITTVSDFPDFYIELIINSENDIKIDLNFLENGKDKVVCLLYTIQVLDSEGKIVCILDEEDYEQIKEYSIIIYTFDKILPKQPKFDWKTCILCLEISMNNEKEFSWIETTSPVTFTEVIRADENQAVDSHQLNMKHMYISKQFCDVILQLPKKRKKFEAHKVVLCAQSPVFCAMFENKMKESKTNTIRIVDLDEATVSRMLMFMYSGVLEDLECEDIQKLYIAADKYQIQLLLDKCVAFFKSKITVGNAVSLLSLSDTHSDNILKSYVSEFIISFIKVILITEEWKAFSKENSAVAYTILEKVCMQNLIL